MGWDGIPFFFFSFSFSLLKDNQRRCNATWPEIIVTVFTVITFNEMAVLLRFLEPLIYPPPWSIINANSTENDVLSPSFLPCNEKIPHCNFFSKRHTNYLFFVHITNSQTFRFSIYRDFPRDIVSLVRYSNILLFEEKRRNDRRKQRREGKQRESDGQRNIYTETILFSSTFVFLFSILRLFFDR